MDLIPDRHPQGMHIVACYHFLERMTNREFPVTSTVDFAPSNLWVGEIMCDGYRCPSTNSAIAWNLRKRLQQSSWGKNAMLLPEPQQISQILSRHGAARYLSYSRILVTTPAPTVRPPSLTAKRNVSSMAIGSSSSISISTLSPGKAIEMPSGRVIAPVTSAVRT